MMVEEARKTAREILSLSKSLPIQILIRIKRGALVRFTNNGVHQNGFQDLLAYTLRLLGRDGPVYLESNDGSKAGIKEKLSQIRHLTPEPASLTTFKKMASPKVKEHFSLTLRKIPEMATSAIEEGIDLIRKEQASANGYFSAYERFFYLADSKGFELSHPTTAVRFGVTITKGSGKGYSSFYHPDPRKLKVASVIQEASKLAQAASFKEVSVKSGEYECVFHPRAFLELIEPLRHHFDAHLYESGKSVLSGFLGKQIFSENFTLHENMTHPRQFGIPFDMDGAPRRKVVLVDRGILRGLLDRGNSFRWISEHAVYPQNLVGQQGALTLDEVFKRIRRGIFINKLRYHTLVREKELEVTGLATAGSLYIEKGRVLGRVGHLRYHDSLISILRFVSGQTKEQVLLKDGEMGAALLPYFWISKLRVV